MKGQPSISPVYRMGEQGGEVDPEKAFARNWNMMRQLWVERGVVSLYPSDLPAELRSAIETWANETYGERRNAR